MDERLTSDGLITNSDLQLDPEQPSLGQISNSLSLSYIFSNSYQELQSNSRSVGILSDGNDVKASVVETATRDPHLFGDQDMDLATLIQSFGTHPSAPNENLGVQVPDGTYQITFEESQENSAKTMEILGGMMQSLHSSQHLTFHPGVGHGLLDWSNQQEPHTNMDRVTTMKDTQSLVFGTPLKESMRQRFSVDGGSLMDVWREGGGGREFPDRPEEDSISPISHHLNFAIPQLNFIPESQASPEPMDSNDGAAETKIQEPQDITSASSSSTLSSSRLASRKSSEPSAHAKKTQVPGGIAKSTSGSNSRKSPTKASSTLGSTRISRELFFHCLQCAKRLGTLYLFGDSEAFSEPYQCDASCRDCWGLTDGLTVGGSPGGEFGRTKGRRRGGAAGKHVKMSCQICLTVVGYGGVRHVHPSNSSQSVATRVGAGSKGGEREDGYEHEDVNMTSWSVPDFGVEVICFECFTDYSKFIRVFTTVKFIYVYALNSIFDTITTNVIYLKSEFCSKCGGGGIWRSGRWRPHQLFHQDRKTCRLPHIRPGPPTDYRYVIYRIPVFTQTSPYGAHPFSDTLQAYPVVPISPVPYADANKTLEESLERLANDTVAFWRESSINTVADGFTMKRAAFAGSWEQLLETEAEFSKQLDTYVKGKVGPDAQVDPSKRVHRYLCLAFFPSARLRRGNKQKSEEDDGGDYVIGGCCTAQFFIEDRHIAGRFGTSVGQFGLHPNSMIPSMVLSLFHFIKSDIETYLLPPPLYVWGFSSWGRGRERTRKCLLMDVLRYGGMTLYDYCKLSGMDVGEMRALLQDWIAGDKVLEERDIYIGEWSGISQLIVTVNGRIFSLSGLE
ncbi:hypothetical protein HDU67_000275 [Dinochytrium kinnereticum]|nr:hypothetical protein HDU67_000275 [Dinochytrium kinnereticum]